ncbi:MAG TPA: phenylalanine--tRNA ligase beta subunit-related protein [Candidatus Acidoferrales bacterium]|nr:phenylalanine--tRNA ligase beta subunit-related protein [Candidatus Acidoferrales bacterium]
MRLHLLSRVLGGGGADLPLSVRSQIDLEFTALELHELEVTEPRVDFHEEIARATQAARAGQVRDAATARALYRRFGVDPTRYRPSSEALLRRVRRAEPLPRINSLVDVANVMSLRLQIPVGLYDLDRVQGPELVIRLGSDGEGYTGIGKEQVNLAGRICVADAAGACGNPSADSARTMITTATERAAWIYFMKVGEPELDRTAELITRYGRGLVRVLTPL